VIRSKGILILAVGITVFVGSAFFLFDSQLKRVLEKELTELNGAQVNIGSLRTQIFKGVLTLSDIQFADPFNSMKNTFDVKSVSTEIDISPLFRKKLVFRDMKIRGIQWWTNRQSPGLYEFDVMTGVMPASVLDRAATGIYSGIRNELTDNPLRHLGQLGSGFTVQSKLGTISDKLASIQHLKSISKSLQEKELLWERQKSELPSAASLDALKLRLMGSRSVRGLASEDTGSAAKQELEDKIKQVSTRLGELSHELNGLSDRLSKTNQFLEKDLTLVRRELGLPNSVFNDLTNFTFGPYWLGLLEKLSYWLEFSRKQSPVGTQTNSYTLTVMNRQGYRSVHFGKLGALPAFLLEKASIHSGGDEGPQEITMDGTLTGLTSDPALYRKPTYLKLTANYPEKGFRNLNFTCMIDHTHEAPLEKLDLTIDSFRLLEWPITRTPDIKLQLNKAVASLSLTGSFYSDQIDLTWNIGVSEAEYGIQSRFRPVEQTLQSMLAGLYSFNLDGKITGSPVGLQFEASSGLGQKLADGLKTEFRHEFGALDHHIITETQSLFPPLTEAIQVRLRKHRDETEPAFRRALDQLKQLSQAPLHSPAIHQAPKG